jgi:hypothetical protein
MDIRTAFHQVCAEAKPAESYYISLYIRAPYFGGPEEGGWWGEDVCLFAAQHYTTDEAADAALVEIQELVKGLNVDAKKAYGEQCQTQLDFCEERGIEDSNNVFGEVDGEEAYFVVKEKTKGESESFGPRHYE